MCHLGTLSTGLHLEPAPGHMYTAWEWIKAVLNCLLKYLCSSYFFFPVDKCLKTLFMCPSNLETRQQRDLYLCNKLRSVLKSSLAAAPEVEALSCSWCRATPGSHFYHSTAHSSATQQKTLPGKDTFIPINILFIHPCFSLSCTPC